MPELYREANNRRFIFARSNNSSSPAVIMVQLSDLNGSPTAREGAVAIDAHGQAAMFLKQIPSFDSLQNPFRGVLRVSSVSSISLIGLRGRYNERNDFLITPTTPANKSDAAVMSPPFLPDVVDSGGYRTEFVVFSSGSPHSSSGLIQLFSLSGGPTSITLQ